VSAVASALGVSRPHLSSRPSDVPRRRGRPPLPDAELLAAIQTLVTDLPTYGYRRVHALLCRQAEREDRPAPNVKRVYCVMKLHELLLRRHAGGAEERRHEGRVAVDVRNTRWCSDGMEIGCDNGERVRVAFALDCCDREAISFVATTAGITGEDVRDLMVAAVEHRFGQVNRLPSRIEWLTDNGSCYLARETRRFARDVGLVPRTTPLESPQSNGMAEAFVRTLKRDYVRVSPVPDARRCSARSPSGSSTTTTFTLTARWATVRPASSSPDQSERTCPGIKGQQQQSAAPVPSTGA
jgi:putative transposase